MSAQRYACLSDRELVSLAESVPVFQRDGIEREVLLRLAAHCTHEAAESDTGRVLTPSLVENAERRRYNDRS